MNGFRKLGDTTEVGIKKIRKRRYPATKNTKKSFLKSSENKIASFFSKKFSLDLRKLFFWKKYLTNWRGCGIIKGMAGSLWGAANRVCQISRLCEFFHECATHLGPWTKSQINNGSGWVLWIFSQPPKPTNFPLWKNSQPLKPMKRHLWKLSHSQVLEPMKCHLWKKITY